MKHYLIVLICMVVSGCASPNLGEPYNPGLEVNLDEEQSVIVVFADADIDERIGFVIWHNGKRTAWLFPNSFIRIISTPGTSEMGFGEYVPKPKFFEDPPESYTMLGSPFPTSFSDLAGGKIEQTIDLEAGEVFYIRIRKEMSEVFETCGETTETTDVCSKKNYTTVIERVDKTTAIEALTGMRESL